MLNGINNNDSNELINARLNGQSGVGSVVTNPIGNNNPYNKEAKYNFVDVSSISTDAYYLYQREQDVQSFTKLVMAGMDDTSYNDRVEELFANGVTDPFLVDDTDLLADDLLSSNKFVKDIEFNML
ncbi:hypothetical protein IJ843_06520 [bacterium]|nr:hypothetical protein [bacterium]